MSQDQVELPGGQPREDIELMYGAALRVAVDAITNGSAFPPFALTVKSDGELSGIKAELQPGQKPEVQHVLEELVRGLRTRAEAGAIRGCVIAIDISMRHPEGGPSDGIKLDFEHAAADPVTMIVPYLPDQTERGEPELHPAFAMPPEHRVFDRPEDGPEPGSEDG